MSDLSSQDNEYPFARTMKASRAAFHAHSQTGFCGEAKRSHRTLIFRVSTGFQVSKNLEGPTMRCSLVHQAVLMRWLYEESSE
jgi:hypothetical protein